MRSRFSWFRVSWFVLFIVTLSATAALAQVRLDIFVTPIPNAPFSAIINVQRSFVRPDGSIVELKTVRNIGRDSKGQIYNEARALVPSESNEPPQLMGVLLYDPTTRTSITLHPQQRTYSGGFVNRPPETEPPSLLFASPTAGSKPQNTFTKEEDLGNREMEGVPVHGVRVTQTISAEDSGTGKEMAITDEYWYSADLRINMLIKHNDPRTGAVSLAVTQVSRSEPDPAYLEIPDGFVPVGFGPVTTGRAR